MIFNPIRKIVGGPKIRTNQHGFDLDLTYITNRLIAMAFPASGFEKVYRNSIDDVSEYLNKKHEDHYLIFNLSGRKYDTIKFNNKVLQYGWQDHQAPTLYTLFQICRTIEQFLKINDKNVIVVHCNHGKGRTGTIIVCFLLYTNYMDSAQEAMLYYSNKRFNKQGYGVTQPCQIRYIKYFQNLLCHKKIDLLVFRLTKIEFNGKHNFQNCFGVLRFAKNKQLICKTETIKNQKQIILTENCPLIGDIYIQFYDKGLLSDNCIARVSFNTIFIPKEKSIRYKINQISPDSFSIKNKNELSNFQIILYFENYTCTQTNLICSFKSFLNSPELTSASTSQIKKCICSRLEQDEKSYWQKIYVILTCHQFSKRQFSMKLLDGE